MSETEDRAEIEHLHALFAHAADRGDYELLRALYTDDATDDHGGYDGPVDGYIDWVRETHRHFEAVSHLYGKPLIFLDGDYAESEIKGHVFVRIKGHPARNQFSISRTFDKYRRTADGWRFTRRAICLDWIGPEFEPAMDLPFVRLKSVMGPDDPIYSETPRLAEALRSRVPPKR